MTPPGARVRPEERHVSDQFLSPCVTRSHFEECVSTYSLTAPLRVPLDTQTPHDFQQAGVIGQAQLLRSLRNMPLVSFESLDDDLPLCLEFLFLERAWCV